MMSTCLHMMSTFQSKKKFLLINVMADSDTSQQVTSKTPATKQKDPKKVAAGKALQEKNRKAREEQRKIIEAQKKALDEANLKIAKYETPAVDTPVNTPVDTPVDKNVITTTQWLSAISIFVSLLGIYYKREEIKGLLTKKPPLTPPPVPPNSPVKTPPSVSPNSPVKTPPSVSPNSPVKTPPSVSPKRGIRPMD